MKLAPLSSHAPELDDRLDDHGQPLGETRVQKPVELVVEADEAGMRLDVVLVRRLPSLSRARAKVLLEAGEVRLNGRRCRKGARVSAGDRVALESEPEPSEFAAKPDTQLVLPIVHEDDWLVVIDKPAGVPSHPLRAHEIGTVASALVARYPDMAGVGWRPREPGILHRLDTGTSGLMLAARDDMTFATLQRALREGGIEKRYIALVHGIPEVQEIDLPIAPHPSDPRRVRTGMLRGEHVGRGERAAHTEILKVTPVPGTQERVAEIEVRAGAAARHQVRAHLSSLGHPLLGDVLYGAPALPGLDRHVLHASRIELIHPATGLQVAWQSPLPDALRRQALLALERRKELPDEGR